MAGRSHKHRGRNEKGHVDPFHARRKRYEAVLGMIGLGELFAALPRPFQEVFWRFKSPDPLLMFDSTFPNDKRGRQLRKVLESGHRNASFVLKGNGNDDVPAAPAKIYVRDLLSVVAGCRFLVENLPRAGMHELLLGFMTEAKPVLTRFHDAHFYDAMEILYDALHGPLQAFGRLDTRLFRAWSDLRYLPSGKPETRTIVSAVEAQMKSVTLDGETRPMYRVAEMSGVIPEINWVEWDGAALGTGDATSASKRYPVYVQSHALRQLAARVNYPAAAPYLEGWLGLSLGTPNIVERQGNKLLVEFRVKEHRLGYLVATQLDDMIAIRTFLFLTMQETPEGRMLRKRLHLTRRDVDWLGLAELTTFTRTDLRDDEQLRGLMAACGCGHLFELEEEDYTPQPKAFAAEMRKYLRMAA